MTAAFAWNDEAEIALRLCFIDGMSASTAAARLTSQFRATISRNAVIGKWHRGGMKRGHKAPQATRSRIPGPRVPRQPQTRKLPLNEQTRVRHMLDGCTAPEPLPPQRIDDLAIPQKQRRALMQLESFHCRWPVGDPATPEFFFCGAPEADVTDGCPYCPAHAALAYAKPAKVSAETEARRQSRAA